MIFCAPNKSCIIPLNFCDFGLFMKDKLMISYLTGSAKAIENNAFNDVLEARPRYSISQMFFKPYESTQEFIFCARHTLIPLAIVGLMACFPIVPIVALFFPVWAASCLALSAIAAGISYLCDSKRFTKYYTDVFFTCLENTCQTLIDIALLPISLAIMTTRGISTALKSSGIYDFDAPNQEAASASI